MPKFRVTIITDSWEKGDIVDFHHGTVASDGGTSTKDVVIEASDVDSAVEAQKKLGCEVSGTPVLLQ
mgnify:CR=1 FL=1